MNDPPAAGREGLGGSIVARPSPREGDSVGKTAAYTQQIQKNYPELRIETATFNQDGQYNDVLIVNDTLVFRFAKVRPAIDTLRHEVAVLRCLQDHLLLSIPHPIYYNIKTDVIGEAFAGYRMIPGRPLWRDEFGTITDPRALRRMATQLAGFLYELHHVPTRSIIPVDLPCYETDSEWVDLYDRIKASLFPLMRREARKQVADHFEGFFDDPGRYRFRARLRHGDFGTGNIIYDPRHLSIAGIIDFGHVGLGDPACDFAGLHISYGEAFYSQCYSVYPEMEQALDRVHFYRGTFALHEALFGLDNGDRDAFESGMAQYV